MIGGQVGNQLQVQRPKSQTGKVLNSVRIPVRTAFHTSSIQWLQCFPQLLGHKHSPLRHQHLCPEEEEGVPEVLQPVEAAVEGVEGGVEAQFAISRSIPLKGGAYHMFHVQALYCRTTL